jgi:hypothetical protein
MKADQDRSRYDGYQRRRGGSRHGQDAEKATYRDVGSRALEQAEQSGDRDVGGGI